MAHNRTKYIAAMHKALDEAILDYGCSPEHHRSMLTTYASLRDQGMPLTHVDDLNAERAAKFLTLIEVHALAIGLDVE